MKHIKDYFEEYMKKDLKELHELRLKFLETKEHTETQYTGLQLAIDTKERNPDYSHLYKDHLKEYNEKRKGKFTKIENK